MVIQRGDGPGSKLPWLAWHRWFRAKKLTVHFSASPQRWWAQPSLAWAVLHTFDKLA
jgi:hypothetical protein